MLKMIIGSLFGHEMAGDGNGAGDTDLHQDDNQSEEAKADAAIILSLNNTEIPDQNEDGDSDFKIVFKRWRQICKQWACENPNLLSELVLIRIAFEPLVSLMKRQSLA